MRSTPAALLKTLNPGAVDVAQLKRWMLASYRAQAPKKLVKALEEAQPWVRAGGLPEAPPRRSR